MLLISRPSDAAFCSLRDPINAISTLYPAAKNHRSIVRAIDQNTRSEVSKRLPFSLHFNELGKHTLYVAMNDKMPIGFIHSRSEPSNWGLMEIAWAISLDMTIDGIYIQRCRDPVCSNKLFIKAINQLTKGRDFKTLLALLDEKLDHLNSEVQAQFPQQKKLVLSIIKSALKTLIITETAWSEDINTIKRQLIVKDTFQHREDIAIIPFLFSSKEKKDLSASIIQTDSIKAFKLIYNVEELGLLAQSKWKIDNKKGSFIWIFSQDGTVLNVQPNKQWPSEDIAKEFKKMEGKNVSDASRCSTATDFAANLLFNITANPQ